VSNEYDSKKRPLRDTLKPAKDSGKFGEKKSDSPVGAAAKKVGKFAKKVLGY